MSYLLGGIVLGILLAGFYGFRWQSRVYQQLIEALESERDHARHECEVFRGLMFPALKPLAAKQPQPITPAPSRLSRGRTPFRSFFNQVRKQTNTPQIKTDALARAIEQAQEQQKRSQDATHA